MEKVRKLVREILMEANLLGQETEGGMENELAKNQEDLEQQAVDLEDMEKYMRGLEKGQDPIIKNKIYSMSHPDSISPDKKVQTKFRALTTTEKQAEEEKQKKYADVAKTMADNLKSAKEKIETLQKTGEKDKIAKTTQETGDVVGTPEPPSI